MATDPIAGPVDAAWTDLLAAAADLVGRVRWELAGAAVASVLEPATDRSADLTSPAARLGAQMTADVSGVGPDLRGDAGRDLGAALAGFALAVWVLDADTRSRAATAALGLPAIGSDIDDGRAGRPGAGASAWAEQDRFLRAVARLDHLDPLVSELVRLRGANAHGCRVCRSRRSRKAVAAAGDPGVLDTIGEATAPDSLPPRHRLAIEFIDAFVWQPMRWPAGLAERLRDGFDEAELTELVLDAMRNSANKIAVALDADASRVEGGVELYDIDPATGELLLG